MFLNSFIQENSLFFSPAASRLKYRIIAPTQKYHVEGFPRSTVPRRHIPLYVSLPLSVSSMPNATATMRCLSLALWRVSIGRDRRNLISMKRALGDFIRATSYPTFPLAAAGEMFPRSIIPQTSPELLRRLLVDQ